MEDLFDIIKFIVITIVIIIWFVYTNLKKSKKSADKYPQNIRPETIAKKRTEQSSDIDNILKSFFGLPTEETQHPIPQKNVIKSYSEKKQVVNKDIPKKVYKTSPKDITIEEKAVSTPEIIEKKDSNREFLVFSKSPIVQGIILNEILGTPTALKNDQFPK